MKTYLLLFLISFSVPFFSMGQNVTQTIRGHVIDVESQIPLPGATIVLQGTSPLLGTTTNENGEFKIENVAVGRYNIQVSFIGYEPVVVPEVLISSGKEKVLSIPLKESVYTTEAVVISSTIEKDKSLNTMAVVSARTFSVEETRRYAGGIDDPARMASSFAGVTTGAIQDNAIVIRGNAPKGVQWRLEGVEVPNPNHFAGANVAGGGAVTIVSSQLLSNSDFYTGAFPAEYGNALSGVFDINLRNGNNQKYEYALQLGALGVDVSAEGPLKKGSLSSFLFNYRYSTLGLLTAAKIIDSDQIPLYQDLSFKFNFPTKKSGTFSLWGIGALDKNNEIEEKDSTKWESSWDRTNYKMHLNIGAVGLSHKKTLGKSAYVKTSIAASANESYYYEKRLNDLMVLADNEYIDFIEGKYTLSSFVNKKINTRHTNRTGVILNRIFYDFDTRKAIDYQNPMTQIVDAKANSYHFQFYSQSKYHLSKKLMANLGCHTEFFALNNNYTIEPRASLKWQFSPLQSFSLGFGKHSQLEQLMVYNSQIELDNRDIVKPNKNLDFAHAYHFVLGYDYSINEHLRIKIEPYYQYLYDVPVIIDSSFSFVNYETGWFISDTLVNEGTGTNIGVDVTLERFLHNNFYYLITGSIFDSKYKGGDGKEYNSMYNKNFVFNFLAGKEWEVGRSKNNFLGLNGKLTILGGNRYNPIDDKKSSQLKKAVENFSTPYSEKKEPDFFCDLSLTYRKNKQKHASIWALQVKNLLGAKTFDGYYYSYEEDKVIEDYYTVIIPSISYKIEF